MQGVYVNSRIMPFRSVLRHCI